MWASPLMHCGPGQPFDGLMANGNEVSKFPNGKRQQWRGSQGEKGLEAAPVLRSITLASHLRFVSVNTYYAMADGIEHKSGQVMDTEALH